MEHETTQEPAVNQNSISDRAVKKICGNTIWMSMAAIFFFGLAALLIYGLITHIQMFGFEGQMVTILEVGAFIGVFSFLGFLLIAISSKLGSYKSTKDTKDLESGLTKLTLFWMIFGIFGVISIAILAYLVFGGLS